MHTINIDFLKNRIIKNQKKFLNMEKAIEREKDLNKQYNMACDAATLQISSLPKL